MYISLSLLSCIYSRVFGRVTGCVVDVHTVQNQVVDHKHIFITRIHPTNGSYGASFSEATPPNYSNCACSGARARVSCPTAMLMSDEDADLVLLEDDVILGEVVMS